MDITTSRVVVLEDEAVMSAFILNSLKRLGIQDIHSFTDGSAAIDEVVKLKPDLILTDIHMEPVGGIEFVRQLRALPDHSPILRAVAVRRIQKVS